MKLFVVDAFTDSAFRGNPAGVALGHGDDAWMQQVAAEMKHSETAFLRKRDDGSYDLRWFTPAVEVDLCGHATLASAHVLYETGLVPTDATIMFHTRSGELRAANAGSAGVTLDFPIGPIEPAEPIPQLVAALGVSPVELLRTDGEFYGCVLADGDDVVAAAPDLAALRTVDGVRGVYLTAPSTNSEYDIVSRCFAPKVGIDEDPATGSMHSVLAAYWCPKLGKDELRAWQASPRGAEMTVLRKGDRALLTGHAVTVLEAELLR
jgi:PhzF family phenazine biosynthesis protein